MNVLRLATVILSLITIIPIGHAIIPIAVLEIAILTDIFSGQFELDFSESFYDRGSISSFINLIGQSVMISGFFFFKRTKSILTIIGILLLLIAIFILTMDPGADSVEMMILMFSLPFLGTALVLLVLEIKDLIQNAKAVNVK